MTPRLYVRRSRVEAPAEDLFAWHGRPASLERPTPHWEPVEVGSRVGTPRGRKLFLVGALSERNRIGCATIDTGSRRGIRRRMRARKGIIP